MDRQSNYVVVATLDSSEESCSEALNAISAGFAERLFCVDIGLDLSI